MSSSPNSRTAAALWVTTKNVSWCSNFLRRMYGPGLMLQSARSGSYYFGASKGCGISIE